MKTMSGNDISRSLRTMAGVLLLGVMCACNKGDDIYVPEQPGGNTEGPGTEMAQLELIVSKKGGLLGPKTWSDGNTLGLFLTERALGRPYREDADIYSNIKAYMLAGTWYLTPKQVMLTGQEAVVYAYSPYISGVDPFAVPVDTDKGIDYMYGTHLESQKGVDNVNPTAAIEMQHALSLIHLKVRKNHNFKAQAKLQEISLEAADDSLKLPVKGTLDIQTGKLTPDGYGRYTLQGLQQVLPDEYADSCTYRMFVIPRDNAEGEVQLTIKVNGNTLSMPLKDGNDWLQGVQNTYNIVFDGDDMRIEKVEINQWKEINIDGEIEGK